MRAAGPSSSHHPAPCPALARCSTAPAARGPAPVPACAAGCRGSRALPATCATSGRTCATPRAACCTWPSSTRWVGGWVGAREQGETAAACCARALSRLPSPLPLSSPPLPPARLPQYLSCDFPPQFGALTQLELLDLTMNDLGGTVDGDVAAGEGLLSQTFVGQSVSCSERSPNTLPHLSAAPTPPPPTQSSPTCPPSSRCCCPTTSWAAASRATCWPRERCRRWT